MASGKTSPYRNIWRQPYEAYAAVAWGVAAVITGLFYGIGERNWTALVMAVIAGMAGMHRFRQGRELIGQRISIAGGGGVATMTRSELLAASSENHDGIYLGKGWEWQPRHTKMCHDLFAKNKEDIPPIPKWILKLYGKTAPHESFIGDARIHGMEQNEGNVYELLSAAEGHTLIVGTTGSGKTRLYEVLVTQAIHSGAVVIVIDPKGDRDLANRMRKECKIAGRPFLYFHPAFPSKSIRFNPLKNWNNISELASRIAQLLGESDSFVEFSHLTIDRVNNGLVAIGIRPTLRNIMDYLQNGIDKMLETLLEKVFYETLGDGWEKKVAGQVQKNNGLTMMEAKIALYTSEVRPFHRNEVIDGLVSIKEHDKEHYGKLIVRVLPLMQMLTSGETGELLSPDHENLADERPIYDSEKIIEGNMVLYMGLDSLSNKQVGGAIGSIALADLAAVAGAIYNFGTKKDIYLFVDEANEAMNDQFIGILNKGRGAGFKGFFATQTIADIEARLGSKAKASQALGNANNVIALRLRDPDTAKFVTEMFGSTTIKSVSVSQSNRAESETHFMEFGGTVTRAMKSEEADLMPKEVLFRLPNLQFVAYTAGGRVSKGRIPIILDDIDERQAA